MRSRCLLPWSGAQPPGRAGERRGCRAAERASARGRAPAYGLRVNRLRTSAPALAERLGGAGLAAAPSRLLPDDFLVLEAGMQTVLESAAVADGLCQARPPGSPLTLARVRRRR